jgi:hypothetical protein
MSSSARIRRLSLLLAGLSLCGTLLVSQADAGSVRGHFRQDGTYVQPYFRSAPDSNPYNNYNFPGNYNPNSGQLTPGNPDTYLNRYYTPTPMFPTPRR